MENKDFLWRPSLKMAAISNFLVAKVCISKVCLIRKIIAKFSACINNQKHNETIPKLFKSDLWVQCYGKHIFYDGHLKKW